ncbi:MAG: hypothetical protein JXR50_11480 [Prolixibacteraceae bacterium]|nr:hypothetical protein [Prolixibacteraceae bacterium]MBN2650350.1 hypothetical protein [Prolixibacteraceae bacterium]
MRKIALICCIFVASLFMYSCEEEIIQEKSVQGNEKVVSLTDEQIDQNIENISIVLANAVHNNKELVTEIEKEISYRFDYDNDALIKIFLGREIAGEKFEEILSKSSNGKYSSKDIETMILESGYLQFTFPQNYESLDYESSSPLAVPVYSFINEQDTEYLESFDKDGNMVSLSAKEMPNVPVIVVGRSERVDEDGYMSVSERSVVLPKEMRSLHYTKAVELSRSPLKSAKTNNHIVKILSQEEFDKLGGGQEPIALTENVVSATDSEANLKSGLFFYAELTVRTDNPKEHKLNWSSLREGKKTSNKYEIYRNDMGNTAIATVINGNSFTDNVPKANYSYEYYVKCYYNDEYLGQSNWYILQSSHRRSGGKEYIDYLYASHAMVVALEGWWVSELEIKWHILAGNYDETSSEIRQGGYDFEIIGKPKCVNEYDNRDLFRWYKNDNYGTYTVHFRERDSSSDIEMWEASVQIVSKTASYIWADNVLVKAIAEGVTEPIIKLVKAYKKDDEIGEAHITWSTPNGDPQYINENGFKVIINHNSKDTGLF